MKVKPERYWLFKSETDISAYLFNKANNDILVDVLYFT